MIINSNVSETNCTKEIKAFDVKNSAVTFQILSSNLYKHPIQAIIREILSNAYDAHIAAKTLDIPITIKLPTQIDSALIIRDYGTGLSEEEVLGLYTTFFDSSKRSSNDYNGGWGLGSKTPYAYTTSYTVTSYYNGVKTVYAMTKIDGIPNVIKLDSVGTEEINGLEVSIPIQLKDIHLFTNETYNYLALNREILTTLGHMSNVEYYFDNIKVLYSTRFTEGKICIKQGNNIFSLHDNMTKEEYEKLPEIASNYNLLIEVPIGTLSVTPSRENIHFDNDTKIKFHEIVNKVHSRILTELENNKHFYSYFHAQWKLGHIVSYVNDKLCRVFNGAIFHPYNRWRYYVEFNASTVNRVLEYCSTQKYKYRANNSIIIYYKSKLSIPKTTIRKVSKYSNTFVYLLDLDSEKLNTTDLYSISTLKSLIGVFKDNNINIQIMSDKKFVKEYNHLIDHPKLSKDKSILVSVYDCVTRYSDMDIMTKLKNIIGNDYYILTDSNKLHETGRLLNLFIKNKAIPEFSDYLNYLADKKGCSFDQIGLISVRNSNFKMLQKELPYISYNDVYKVVETCLQKLTYIHSETLIKDIKKCLDNIESSNLHKKLLESFKNSSYRAKLSKVLDLVPITEPTADYSVFINEFNVPKDKYYEWISKVACLDTLLIASNPKLPKKSRTSAIAELIRRKNVLC